MERIQTLINQLQDQVNNNVNPSQLQFTLQLLQAEINKLQNNGAKILGTSKVSVIMPSSGISVLQEVEKDPKPVAYQKQKPVTRNQINLHFDPIEEVPTFTQQHLSREINESVIQEESLNDRLKEDKTEVMQVIKDSPIRDLRKAVGINDRFVFINELFRGEEAMYERCIKTINSFNIYPEAEYWMNRELMVKLGWDMSKESAKHFYQLVKRRFS